jgi:hypothetical protein
MIIKEGDRRGRGGRRIGRAVDAQNFRLCFII